MEDVNGWLEKLQNGFPADWFNIKINGHKFIDASFNLEDQVADFENDYWHVSFNCVNETCSFYYYEPGPK